MNTGSVSLAGVEIAVALGRHQNCGGIICLQDVGEKVGRGVCNSCGKRWRVRLHVELVPLEAAP